MTPDEADRELLRFAAVMRDLVNSKMWKTYSSIIESQIKERENIILNNPAGLAPDGETPMDRLLRIEQVKGARLGLRLALDTPERIIEDATAVNSSGSDQEENE